VKGRIEMVVALSNPTNGPLNANEVITDISDLGLFDGVASGYSGAGSELRFGSHGCSTPDYELCSFSCCHSLRCSMIEPFIGCCLWYFCMRI